MKWIHPMDFVGEYPETFGGYTFLQWSTHSNSWHEGVDYNGEGGCDADAGSPLYACADGVVDWVGYHNGWGYHFFIKHNDPIEGTIFSHYAHCQKGSISVKAGETVKVGQEIAKVGDSGWNYLCAHVHFEIRRPIGKGYEFYPKGWDKDQIKKYYFDPFLFIEARKTPEAPVSDPCAEVKKEWEAEKKSLKAEIKTLKEEIKKKSEQITKLEEKVSELRPTPVSTKEFLEAVSPTEIIEEPVITESFLLNLLRRLRIIK